MQTLHSKVAGFLMKGNSLLNVGLYLNANSLIICVTERGSSGVVVKEPG